MIFRRKLARPRREAVRAGWNDAAWGRSQHQVESVVAQSYASGYAGGLVFREKEQAELLQHTLVSNTLPRPRAGSLSPGPRAT